MHAAEMSTRLQLLYRDDELVVFNKPSGMPSTVQAGQTSGTAVHEAVAQFADLPFASADELRISQERGLLLPRERGLLHRLDTGTSGALAFARTESAYPHLRALWKTDVVKIYRAIVAPSDSDTAQQSVHERSHDPAPPSTPSFLRSLPRDLQLEIAHDAKSARRMRVLDPSLPLPMKQQLRRIRGRPQAAHTRILSATAQGSCFDLEIRIFTGVMHQIRVHLAHLGLPIVGDPIYRGRPGVRLWLHAWKLELAGRRIVAPLPIDWPGASQ